MRKELVASIKAALVASGAFSKVTGLGAEKPTYPLVRVYIPGSKDENLDNSPQVRLDMRVAVQIETNLETDANGDTLDGPLYDLVDSVFSTLQNIVPPGIKCGVQPLAVLDSPGLGAFNQEGPTVYLLQVATRVIPATFSLNEV